MKYIIASDIHGSPRHTSALLDAFRREEADGLILLGDILSHTEADREAALLLNTLADRIIAVRGNCDRTEDQSLLNFPMTDTLRRITDGPWRLLLTHGHIYDPLDPPEPAPGDIMLSGHTHVPASSHADGVWFLNPGSLSLPRRGSPHSYMTMENGLFLWKTAEGEAYRELEVG